MSRGPESGWALSWKRKETQSRSGKSQLQRGPPAEPPTPRPRNSPLASAGRGHLAPPSFSSNLNPLCSTRSGPALLLRALRVVPCTTGPAWAAGWVGASPARRRRLCVISTNVMATARARLRATGSRMPPLIAAASTGPTPPCAARPFSPLWVGLCFLPLRQTVSLAMLNKLLQLDRL